MSRDTEVNPCGEIRLEAGEVCQLTAPPEPIRPPVRNLNWLGDLNLMFWAFQGGILIGWALAGCWS